MLQSERLNSRFANRLKGGAASSSTEMASIAYPLDAPLQSDWGTYASTKRTQRRDPQKIELMTNIIKALIANTNNL